MKSCNKGSSKIGFGLSQLNNNLYLKRKFSHNEITNLIYFAIEKGIKYFDTANNYGETEKILGRLDSNIKRRSTFLRKVDLSQIKKDYFLKHFWKKI